MPHQLSIQRRPSQKAPLFSGFIRPNFIGVSEALLHLVTALLLHLLTEASPVDNHAALRAESRRQPYCFAPGQLPRLLTVGSHRRADTPKGLLLLDGWGHAPGKPSWPVLSHPPLLGSVPCPAGGVRQLQPYPADGVGRLLPYPADGVGQLQPGAT